MEGLADLVADAGRFYANTDPPLQQGDIVLAPVGRVHGDVAVIPRWEAFDQAFSEPLRVDSDLPEIVACAGYGVGGGRNP